MLQISYTSGMRNTSYPTFLPDGLIESPGAVVEIETPNTSDWTVAGWLTPVFGDIEGVGIKAILGKKLYEFAPPGYPYSLKFRSKPWIRPWNLRIYKDSEQFRPRLIQYQPSLSPHLVLAVRGDRLGATLQNTSGVTIYVGFTQNLTLINAIDRIVPGAQWLLDGKYIGEIWMIADAVGIPVSVVEYAKNPFS